MKTYWPLLLPLLCTSPLASAETSASTPADTPPDQEAQLELPSMTIQGQSSQDLQLPLGLELSAETLGEVPGSAGDPLKAIQSFPGIVVNDDASSAPAIRGSGPRDNYYEIDFLPARYVYHLNGGFSTINESLFESFTLYPAAARAEFSEATGGVIDIRLRDPGVESRTMLDVSMLQASLLWERAIDERHAYYVAARRSYFDLFIGDQLDSQDIEFRQFPNYYDYQGKYLWQLERGDRLYFQANGAQDELEIFFPADSKIVAQEPDLLGSLSSRQDYHTQGVVWQRPLDNGRSLKSAISHMNQTENSVIGQAGSTQVGYEQWLLKSHYRSYFGDSHQLTLGGQINHTRISYDLDFQDPGCSIDFDVNCSISDAVRKQSSRLFDANDLRLFLSDEWAVSDPLLLTLGLSYHTEDYLKESFVEPRLQLQYDINPEWQLTAGVGRYHQMPSGEQIIDTFGNRDLKHFKSDHLVMGIGQQLDSGWSWKAESYYKTFTDLVVSNPTTNYSNDGEGLAYGVELLLKKEASESFDGWLALSNAHTERTNNLTGENFRYSYDQPWIVNLVANYRYSPRWHYGVKWRYHSGAPYTPVIDAQPEDPTNPDGRYLPTYASINSDTLPDYHRLDLRITRIFNPKMEGYLELINLYNRGNISGYSYNRDYTQQEPQLQLPFIFSFGLKKEF